MHLVRKNKTKKLSKISSFEIISNDIKYPQADHLFSRDIPYIVAYKSTYHINRSQDFLAQNSELDLHLNNAKYRSSLIGQLGPDTIV